MLGTCGGWISRFLVTILFTEEYESLNNLTDIAVFVRVVDTGGFSAAADRLDLSRAAVSKAVSRLEERLGARLLQRTTRRLSLTESGRALYERSRRALASIEEAEQEIGRLQGEPRGTLRISAPVYFGVHHLTPLLSEYLARHRDLDADVQLDDRLVDIVGDGFDLAIRVSALEDSSLIGRRLAPCHIALCASPDYWERHGRPEAPADLAAHNCFVYSNLSSPGVWRFRDPGGHEIAVTVGGRLRFNNTEMARAAALQGLGVIWVPTFYVGDELRSGRLMRALADYRPAREVSIWAVYPARDHLPVKVRLLIDLLAERFAPEPWWDRH
jgi:DNA-binding transcriptional LysR family regulator